MREHKDEDHGPVAAVGEEPDREAPRLAFDARPDGFAGRLKRLRVAAILDEFSYAVFRNECDLRQLTPNDWRNELDAFRPELLIVESAWRGKDKLWQGRIARFDPELAGILAWCGAHGVPTVFWNKEDPVHFQTFKRLARSVDYVFTTDIDSIAAYQAVLGHDRAFLLPFACQPRLTNPIERMARRDAFAFAGGYYRRYPDRIRDFAEIMGAIREFRPVEIFDRGQGKDDERYRYPAEYAGMIVGTLPFERIDEAYKGYRYGINFNSIKQSQSMFARRVFELLASNTLTVSNYARGLRLMFGDLVIASDCGDTIRRRVKDLAVADGKAERLRLAALRKTLAEHTAADRLAYLVGKVAGIEVPALTPPITMVGQAIDAEGVAALVKAFRRQTYPVKRLVVVTGDGIAAGGGDDQGVHVMSRTAADTMRASDLTGTDGWIAPIDPRDYHGPNYLIDLALATRYAPGTMIGRAAHHVSDSEGSITLHDSDRQYRLGGSVPARTGIVRAEALAETVGTLLRNLDRRSFTGDVLSIDAFSYCRDGGSGDAAVRAAVDDLPELDTGMAHSEMIAAAEQIRLIESPIDGLPRIDGGRLAGMFRSGPLISFHEDGGRLRIESKLAPGQRRQRYTRQAATLAELGAEKGVLRAHLIASGDLMLRVALRFVDREGTEIGAVASRVNRDMEFDLPDDVAGIHIGMRITGPGAARVEALILGHRFLALPVVLSHGNHLVLTDGFPSYDEPEQGRAAYDAAAAARAAGRRPDVFRLAAVEATTYHEYQGFDCVTGTEAALAALIGAGQHRDVEVFATDQSTRAILERHAATIRRPA